AAIPVLLAEPPQRELGDGRGAGAARGLAEREERRGGDAVQLAVGLLELHPILDRHLHLQRAQGADAGRITIENLAEMAPGDAVAFGRALAGGAVGSLDEAFADVLRTDAVLGRVDPRGAGVVVALGLLVGAGGEQRAFAGLRRAAERGAQGGD